MQKYFKSRIENWQCYDNQKKVSFYYLNIQLGAFVPPPNINIVGSNSEVSVFYLCDLNLEESTRISIYTNF